MSTVSPYIPLPEIGRIPGDIIKGVIKTTGITFIPQPSNPGGPTTLWMSTLNELLLGDDVVYPPEIEASAVSEWVPVEYREPILIGEPATWPVTTALPPAQRQVYFSRIGNTVTVQFNYGVGWVSTPPVAPDIGDYLRLIATLPIPAGFTPQFTFAGPVRTVYDVAPATYAPLETILTSAATANLQFTIAGYSNSATFDPFRAGNEYYTVDPADAAMSFTYLTDDPMPTPP